jgi:hypothetical protein
MPVRKFRTLDEAGRPQRYQPGTEEFSRALRSVFRLAELFAPPQKCPPGVFKFRSIEQAQAQRIAWTCGK